MMCDKKKYQGKRILVLGGGQLHCSLVTAAHKLGAKVWVADPEDAVKSPAKLLADHSCKIDVCDVDTLETLCKKEKIDGIIIGFYHAPTLPYIMLCERLNYPCLFTREQYESLNNKNEFSRLCREAGLDVPREYEESELTESFEDYPVIVKPVDSRGSKGQTLCFGYDNVDRALAYAKGESSNKEVIIQQYLSTKKELIIECVVKDGIPYVLLLEDMYYGNDSDGTGRIYCINTASARSCVFYQSIRDKITAFITHIGLINGVCTFQGKRDGDTIRFYDAASRLGGGLVLTLVEKEFGYSASEMLVDYALSGNLNYSQQEETYRFNGKIPVIWYVMLKPGKIAEITGWDTIKKNRYYVTCEERLHIGDTVPDTEDVRRLLGAVLFLFDDENALDDFLRMENQPISVIDCDGNELVIDDLERKKAILKHREDELAERL